MAQDVQTTLNYQAELNQTEWIWYQERRISDKMQVRDKQTNWWMGTSNYRSFSADKIYYITSWDSYESWGDVLYKVDWADLILPYWWAYLVEILPPTQNYSQTNYYYDLIMFQDGVQIFKKNLAYADHARLTIPMNLWKKSRITFGGQASQTGGAAGNFILKLTKL